MKWPTRLCLELLKSTWTMYPPTRHPWLTNKLTAFFDLLSHYPILQTIPTYHSLIGAMFLYRRCVWFQSVSFPCILIVWLIPVWHLILIVIVSSLLTSHDPLNMFNIPVYQCIYTLVCQTVIMLIFSLCRFCVSQFIERLYKTPLCFLILILPSPCLILCYSDFGFDYGLTTLLPIVLYFVFLITWLPTLLQIKQRHGTSRPSPASAEAWAARRHTGVTATTTAGGHAVHADHDPPDGESFEHGPSCAS